MSTSTGAPKSGASGLEGLASNDTLDDDTLFPLDDDIEISFVDDDQAQGLSQAQNQPSQQRRGQNEDQELDEFSASADGLDDIENPRIRDRIMRERRLREENDARSLRNQEELERALLESEKSKLQIQRDAFKLSIDGVDIRIATTTEALKAARMDDDVSAETDIEAKLRELTTIRNNLEQKMGSLPVEADLDAAYAEHVNKRRVQISKSSRSQQDGVRPLNEKAGRWQQNNPWMTDNRRLAENAALLAINDQLVKEGFNPNEDTFFDELTRRMAKSFPSLSIKDLAGRQVAGSTLQSASNQQRRTPPVAGARTTAPAGNRLTSPKRVDLDRNDRAIMRQLGIDPSDQKSVKYFAKQKFERLRAEQARGN